ncbi:MAG: hypothetical protein PHQ34_03330 [Methanothrix sp.]|nr:hypothetical protein [Methanothrix sp.]
MANYSVSRTIINASREELIQIFRWSQFREKDNPITVLVGGWAVYCYNPWYGSVDIDLVTNNKTRQRLMKHLRDDRGFIPQRDPMAPTTVVKKVPEGKILIDFGSREDICCFEGRDEQCPFSLLDGRTTAREILPGFSVIVPERTLLMVFKLKASWDRSFRFQNGKSSDAEWERGKLCKDRADILALLDPSAGGNDIDISYFGELLNQYPFLEEMLREIPGDGDAINMYRRMNQEDARERIERLLMLVQ